MTVCRIYKPTKNVMQSGRATLEFWVLDYAPAESKQKDPLIGWTGSGDMNGQLKLKFPNKEQAIAYATKKGLAYRVQEPRIRKIQPKNYSDNFSPRFRFS